MLFQRLFSFKTFLAKFSKEFYFNVIFRTGRDQAKQTLAVTLLFQCNFLLVGENFNGNFIFFIGFFRHGAASILKFS